MRRLAPAVLIAASLAALAVPSAATPFTSHFNGLLVEMNTRDSDLPLTGLTKDQKREKAALGRAFRALSADSPDLAGDLAMARKMAGALETGYPGDGAMTALLSLLNDDLAADADAEREEAVVLISIAQEGKTRLRAEAKLAAADALFIAADASATEALRARSLEKGLKAVAKAAALAVKAGPGGSTDASAMSAVVAGLPWAANSKFGTGVTGLADVSASTSGLRKIVVSGRQILPLTTDTRLPGATSRIQITLVSANESIVPGIYAAGASNGVNASAYWFHEDEAGIIDQAVSIGGTFEITSLTVHTGNVDIAGTFSLTMYDGLADAVFDIGSGSFEALGVARATVP
jgi:hypothetical protein